MPSYRYHDGEMVEIPDVVVQESGDWPEPVDATMVITRGVSLCVSGTISGTVIVEPAAALDAAGDVPGTVFVKSGASAVFRGRVHGTLVVEHGGVATLAESAVALGSLDVEGTLHNLGTRGVTIRGSGTVDDRAGSAVRQPDQAHPDGTTIYLT